MSGRRKTFEAGEEVRAKPDARGLGETWQAEIELPTSSLRRLRRHVTDAIAKLDATKGETP